MSSFIKGCTDFKAGKILLKNFEDGDIELDIESIMFHFQQSAEKFLKSILSYNKYHFTKTHNIKELIKAINKNNIDIIKNIEIIIPLTYYAVEGRYSIIHNEIIDTEKYTAILENLKLFLTNLYIK